MQSIYLKWFAIKVCQVSSLNSKKICTNLFQPNVCCVFGRGGVMPLQLVATSLDRAVWVRALASDILFCLPEKDKLLLQCLF